MIYHSWYFSHSNVYVCQVLQTCSRNPLQIKGDASNLHMYGRMHLQK